MGLSTMVAASALDLPRLEEQAFLHVNHSQFEWNTAWNNVLQIGLYQKGPDVSEVGSTWLDNLNDMRALRPFSVAEIHALGGESAFMDSAWHGMSIGGDAPKHTGIPWILDTRLVIYRRDLLALAGVEERGAFATPDAFHDTLARLQSAGLQYPLALATGGLNIHNLASWVWGRGGTFRTPDYRKISLVEAEGRRGLADYFGLHRFIDPAMAGMIYEDANNRYYTGQAAVLLSGQWVMKNIKDRAPFISEPVLDNSGYAAPPGVPFLGAAHLVIWRHSLHDSESLQLINHLTSPSVLEKVFTATGNFPARMSVLNAPPFAGDPDFQLVVDCLRRGRGFRSAHLWAGVEMRLNNLFDQLWADLFANPTLPLEAEIERRVTELANRLEKTLLAN